MLFLWELGGRPPKAKGAKHHTTEPGTQLQWERVVEASTIEEQGTVRGYEILQGQILGEGQHADLQRQIKFDDHTFAQCHTAAFNAWDRTEESGKRTEQFTKIIQGPKEHS